jgi:hypothetical protein
LDTVLSGADLSAATFDGSWARDLTAHHTSFRDGWFYGSEFEGGYLRGADFAGALITSRAYGDGSSTVSAFERVDLAHASLAHTEVDESTRFADAAIAHVRTAGSSLLASPSLRTRFFEPVHARIVSSDGCVSMEGGEHIYCEGHNEAEGATRPFQHNGRFTWRHQAPDGHRTFGIWGGEHKLSGKARHNFGTFEVEAVPGFAHVTGTGDGGAPGEAGGPLALDLQRWDPPGGGLGYKLAFRGWLLRTHTG